MAFRRHDDPEHPRNRLTVDDWEIILTLIDPGDDMEGVPVEDVEPVIRKARVQLEHLERRVPR